MQAMKMKLFMEEKLCVIAHANTQKSGSFIINTSLAINFAVLYDVPTLQVVNTDFKRLTLYTPNLYDYIKVSSI